MKLSDITAKLTSMKGKVIRVLAVGTLAVAALAMAAPAAQAQRFVVSAHFGGPYRIAPPPPRFDGHGYWEQRRIEEMRAREAYLRHEEWVRHHGFYGYRR